MLVEHVMKPSIHRMSLQKKKHLYGGIFFNKVGALASAILL